LASEIDARQHSPSPKPSSWASTQWTVLLFSAAFRFATFAFFGRFVSAAFGFTTFTFFGRFVSAAFRFATLAFFARFVSAALGFAALTLSVFGVVGQLVATAHYLGSKGVGIGYRNRGH
jgi:hypothetical protein